MDAYLLALAALVALGGRIGDLIGRSRAFSLGATLFLGASAACGLAQSDVLIMTPSNTDAMNTRPAAASRAGVRPRADVRNVGGTIGIAVSGTVVAHILHSPISDFIAADTRAQAHDLERVERVLSQVGDGARRDLAPGDVTRRRARSRRRSRAATS